MDKEFIREHLPLQPPKGLIDWAKKNCDGELGPDYIVYHAERVPIMPELSDIMEYNDLRPHRYEWAAQCSCTACGEDFVTQKIAGMDGIRIGVGGDGMPYPVNPGAPVEVDAWNSGLIVEEAFDGEKLICPICMSECELIHSKRLRGGRTKRIMVVSVQIVEGYTTILYWLVCRTINESGHDYVYADASDAYVLAENGSLVHYSRVVRSAFGSYQNRDGWSMLKSNEDHIDVVYPDWGSINNRKCGATIYPVYPDLEGTTGEKTGLIEFLNAEGYRIVPYLKFWRTHRSIENVLKCGQAELVVGIFRSVYRYQCSVSAEMAKYIDLSEKKPNKMLRLSKDAFRELRRDNRKLHVDDLDKFSEYQAAGGKCDIIAFLNYLSEFRTAGMNAAVQIIRQSPGVDLDKIYRYMEKQQMRPTETGILLDSRRMAKELAGDRPLSHEELWPRNLAGTHERLNRIQAERRAAQNKAESEKVRAGFQGVIDRYGCLQWTDGDLCVILPKSSYDLHREGEVLRHCVGGYSNSHIKGTDTIFFIRHYRRPERPYYTLDINMTDKPREVQLHGYGNERHGVNKEHSHKIPAKVRDFCDRWEREVLLPFYYEQQRRAKSEEKERKAV